MTKRSGKLVLSLCLIGALASCAHQENPVSSMPVSGDTATNVLPLPVPETAQATLPVAPAPKISKKGNRAKKAAAKPEVTIIATTNWQDHGPVASEMPMPLPKGEPVMADEVKPVPQEAEVGIIGFIHRYLLVLLSALCLGAAGLYAFFIYPNRRNSGSEPNRFG